MSLAGAALGCLAILTATTALAEIVTLPEKLVGHGGPVKAIVISADGRRALTGAFDYAIIEWDLSGTEGKVHRRLFGHRAAVNDVAYVPRSDMAVSVGDDGAFAIWDLARGEMLHRFDDTGVKVTDVSVSRDGRLAAAARWDGTARVFDLAGQREIAVMKGHRGNVNAVEFSADGKRLYTGSYDGSIREWDSGTGKAMRTMVSHGWGVNVIALTGDGDKLVFGAVDGTLAAIDLGPGLGITPIGKFDRPVLSLSVPVDGDLLAAGTGGGEIAFFHVNDWREVGRNIHAFGPVWGVALTPQQSHIYFVGLDDFAIAWQISPRNPFETISSVFPRRFQVRNTSDRGELEFRRKCSVCHTLVADGGNRAGPTLFGLFGRRAGTLPGYPFSRALKKSDIIWTPDTVSALFEKGPDILTPGSKMPLQRLKNIAHLKQLVRYLEKATATR